MSPRALILCGYSQKATKSCLSALWNPSGFWQSSLKITPCLLCLFFLQSVSLFCQQGEIYMVLDCTQSKIIKCRCKTSHCFAKSFKQDIRKFKQHLSGHHVSFLLETISPVFFPQIFIKNMPKTGSISQVLVQLPHVFQMFPSESFLDHDARWAPQSGEPRQPPSPKSSLRPWTPHRPQPVIVSAENSLMCPLIAAFGTDCSCVSIPPRIVKT